MTTYRIGTLVPCPMEKKLSKKVLSLDFGDNPMDRTRYLKNVLGYFIIYLTIWSFMSHGCFTARNMLKCKEKRELRVLFKTVQDQIREN